MEGLSMTVIACPVTVVDAPMERVWSLVIDPRKVGEWSDARFEAAEPDGPAHAGQRWRFSTAALGRRWPVLMTVTGVAAGRDGLGLNIALPLGIVNEEYISLARLGDAQTRVQFN
jgi:hypothetical protein